MVNKSDVALVLGAQMPQFMYGSTRPAFLSSTGNEWGLGQRKSCILSFQFAGFSLVLSESK